MPSSDTQFKKGNRGKQPGTKNKYSLFKEALVDGLGLAAKAGGLKSVDELVSHTFRKDPVGVLNIVARQIPKDLNIRKKEVLRIILEPPDKEKAEPGVEGG